MRELDALVGSYVHLDKLPRAKDALRELQKIASLVKPIMRRRGWHVGSLTEFWPDQQNLLGVSSVVMPIDLPRLTSRSLRSQCQSRPEGLSSLTLCRRQDSVHAS